MGQTIIKKSELNETIRGIVAEQLGKAFTEEWEKFRSKANEPVTRNAAGIASAGTPAPAPRADEDEKAEAKLGLVRIAKAMALCGNDHERAAKLIEKWGYGRTSERFARALSGTTESTGAALVPVEYSTEFIEMLRNQTVVRQAGARQLTFEGKSLEMGRQDSSATAAWGEEATAVSASQLATGTLKLDKKKLIIITPVGNGLIKQANRSIEQMVMEDLLLTAQVESDAKHLRGAGTASSPRGIRYQAHADNVFTRTGGGTATIATVTNDLTKAIRLVKAANVPVGKDEGVFFMNARSEYFLMSLRDGNNNLVFAQEMAQGRLFGFKYFSTEQLPQTLGGPGDESEIIFAAMPQVLIGEDPEVTVEAIPNGAYVNSSGTMVSGVSADITPIRLVLYTDLALRHRKAASVIDTVDWGA